jgi:beta-phosphoglucomutase
MLPDRPIDTIIFDCEGVIIDSESVWDHGQTEFLRRRGKVYDRALTKHLLTGRSLAEGVRTMQEQYGFGGDPEKLAQERSEIVKELFATEVYFIPGFQEFFETVRKNYLTCIATAMTRELFTLVDRRLGLSTLFNGHVYTLADVGFRSKPDPALFLYAAEKLGSRPASCLVLEDAPHGIEAARRAGMASIGLATTYEPDKLAGADLIVESFSDIELPQGAKGPAPETVARLS